MDQSSPEGVVVHDEPVVLQIVIPEGYHVEIEDMVPGTADIIVTDGKFSVEHRWTYAYGQKAVEAGIEWESRNYQGDEPSGWIRHRPSNRRRHYVDGEFMKEYVAP